MRSRSWSGQIHQALGKWWRKHIVDECPDSRRERLRWELIHGIEQDSTLQEAMRSNRKY